MDNPMPDQAPPSTEPAGANQDLTQDQQQRSKKQQRGRRGRGAAAAQEVPLTAAQAEHVKVIRVEGRRADAEDMCVVALSVKGRAPQLQLSDDRLSVSGSKGFRTVRATHGVHRGAWYCEVRVDHLGDTGHVRLGWCTKKAELQAPVGFDKHGFCYRDLEGSKVTEGLRQSYGKPYGQGDVIGLLMYLPEGGRPHEVVDKAVARYKGTLYYVDEPEPEPTILKGSKIAFTCNGELQGVAYEDILEGTYYPAASLYTLPHQKEGARVTFNFGPDFTHPAPQLEGCPLSQPLCTLAIQKASQMD